MAWRRAEDAWGLSDPSTSAGSLAGHDHRSGDSGGSTDGTRSGRNAASAALLPRVLLPAAGAASASVGAVPTLRALCLGFLGQHVEEAVAQLGPHLGPLPPDVKACLLCAARRRGVLSNRVLLGLADEGWALLDLAGATALSERAVRQALLRCPRLRALDLTGLSCVSAALLRELPAMCPSLELLAVGRSRPLEEAMLQVLPDILPHMRLREDAAVQDNWEDVVGAGGVALPDPGIPCGLQRLALLVWPAAPPLVHHTFSCMCPRVGLAEALPPPPPPLLSKPSCEGSMTAVGGTGSRIRGGGAVASEPAWCYSSSLTGDQWRATMPPPQPQPQPPQSGISVLRVGRPIVGACARGVMPLRSPSNARTTASGGGSGSRYTAPHLRTPQQQQQELQWRHQPRSEASAPAPGEEVPAADPSPAAQPHTPPLLLPQSHNATLAPSQPPRLKHQPLQQQLHQPAPRQPQLDDCLAALVAGPGWRGGDDGGGGGSRAVAVVELHIAEKFRMAYVEQDIRLRAKAVREAAWAERQELRGSGAARALASWLDAE